MNKHRYYGEGPEEGIIWLDVQPQPPDDTQVIELYTLDQSIWIARSGWDGSILEKYHPPKKGDLIVKCEKWKKLNFNHLYTWEPVETMPLDYAVARKWTVAEVLGVELREQVPDFVDGPDVDTVVYDKKWQWKVRVEG